MDRWLNKSLVSLTSIPIGAGGSADTVPGVRGRLSPTWSEADLLLVAVAAAACLPNARQVVGAAPTNTKSNGR